MHLTEELDATGTSLGFKDQKKAAFAHIYQDVIEQFNATKKHRRFSKLWSRVAPSGSIYRYLGLSQERLKHCVDLDRQLREVAEDKKDLLGGSAVPLEERCEKLLGALRSTKSSTGMEAQHAFPGFLPLEEFLDKGVTCTAGFINHPSDPDERSQWLFNHLLAFAVFIIQVFGPVLVIIQLWSGDANPLNNPQKLWSELSWQEMVCLGKDRTAVLTTIMGTLFLFIVNMVIYNHCSDECDDALRSGRLPEDSTWTTLGNIAQIVSSVAVVLAAPIELWTESGVAGIMMNSMAFLFVYSLDDLAGDIFSYVGDDDKEFQQQVSWNYALLAYCPVNIRDLINPKATSETDFWKISYNAEGSLMSQNNEVCETRIMSTEEETSSLLKKKPGEETSLLLKKRKRRPKCAFEDITVVYRLAPDSSPHRLPGCREHLVCYTWYTTKHLVFLFGILIPCIWFVCNKPCKPQ